MKRQKLRRLYYNHRKSYLKRYWKTENAPPPRKIWLRKKWECRNLAQISHVQLNKYISRLRTLNCNCKYTRLGKKRLFRRHIYFLKTTYPRVIFIFLIIRRTDISIAVKWFLSLERKILSRELIEQFIVLWEKTFKFI